MVITLHEKTGEIDIDCDEEQNRVIGTRIKCIRHILSKSSNDIAKELNITRQTLTNYENGKTTIKASVVTSLCKIFGISADWLLGLTNKLCIQQCIDGHRLEIQLTIDE